MPGIRIAALRDAAGFFRQMPPKALTASPRPTNTGISRDVEQRSQNGLLSSVSGEFIDAYAEHEFLEATWKDHRHAARITLLVIAFMGMAFFVGDILNVRDKGLLWVLFPIRLAVVGCIVGSAVYISQAKAYFGAYPILLLFNQLLIAIGLFAVSVLRQMPYAHLGVNTILFTLVYYQFISNRYRHTLLACAVFGVGSVAVGMVYLDMDLPGLVASILFLIPLNFLGVAILRSNNRSKRNEYLVKNDLARSNADKEKLIRKLEKALAEVRTLEGFLPICAHCHKVRDDKGYWERIEKYIQDRTEARFSHSVCPDCAKKLYPEYLPPSKE